MKNKYKILVAVLALLAVWALVWFFLPTGSVKWLVNIIGNLGQVIARIIETLGYPGLAILMALESMIFPLPSELVMPFAGFLAIQGELNLWLIIFWSTIGSLFGSLLSYYIGYYGGNKLVLKLGKYLLLDISDLEKTEVWFKKRGEKTIFISRLIPVVRHLISVPAGIGRMHLRKFCLYTVLGATLWNGFLAYCGYLLGQNWGLVRHYSETFTVLTAAILFLAGSWFIYHHIQSKAREKKALQNLKS